MDFQKAWLRELGYDVVQLHELSGDVSPRRYLRAEGPNKSWIVACYPQSMRETMDRFIATTRLLESQAVRVPRIEHSCSSRGFMLLEDIGTTTLFDRSELPFEELAELLLEALPNIGRIAALDAGTVAKLNPPLDFALLEKELDLTWSVVLEEQGLGLEDPVGLRLREVLRAINERLAKGPQLPCHRDFMVRNLMEHESGEIVVIDHQDLRMGPAGYDLASFLNDSLRPSLDWCRKVAAPASGLDPQVVTEQQLARCAVQRGFKIVGTFHRFAQSGEPRYLPLVPPTLARTLGHLERTLGETVLATEVQERLTSRPQTSL